MPQHTKTILVVDDSPSELALMNATLKGKGYKLVAASNGEEAIEKMASTDMTFALESKQQVEHVLSAMEGINEQRGEAIVRIGEHAQAMDGLVNRAVTALQFQDLVSQLVSRIEQRVRVLDEVLMEVEGLAARIDQSAGTGNPAILHDAVGLLRARLDAMQAASAPASADHPEVSRGEIDLF